MFHAASGQLRGRPRHSRPPLGCHDGGGIQLHEGDRRCGGRRRLAQKTGRTAKQEQGGGRRPPSDCRSPTATQTGCVQCRRPSVMPVLTSHRSLPIAAWPETDRKLWLEAAKARGPLDDARFGTDWADNTRKGVGAAYRRWLDWVLRHDLEAMALPAAARVTRDRMASYQALAGRQRWRRVGGLGTPRRRQGSPGHVRRERSPLAVPSVPAGPTAGDAAAGQVPAGRPLRQAARARPRTHEGEPPGPRGHSGGRPRQVSGRPPDRVPGDAPVRVLNVIDTKLGTNLVWRNGRWSNYGPPADTKNGG